MARVREKIVRGWRAISRALLMQDDTPHRIAMGMALGLLIAWTPTVGIQMLLVFPLAWLLGANRVSAFIGIYLSNPITFLFMYWIDYKLGAVLLHDPLTFQEFQGIVAQYGWDEWWRILVAAGVELAAPIWLGAAILGGASAVIGYFGTLWLVRRFRPEQAAAELAADKLKPQASTSVA